MTTITMEAAYATQCWACGDRIEPGELITGVPGQGQWKHPACPADPTVDVRPICGKCFLAVVHNGTCGCEDD